MPQDAPKPAAFTPMLPDGTPLPKSMDGELLKLITRSAILSTVGNLAAIAAFLAQREIEADAVAMRHAGHDCATQPIAMGIAGGVGGSLAIIQATMKSMCADSGIERAQLTQAIETAERIAADAQGFAADPARLEAFIREMDGTTTTPPGTTKH